MVELDLEFGYIKCGPMPIATTLAYRSMCIGVSGSARVPMLPVSDGRLQVLISGQTVMKTVGGAAQSGQDCNFRVVVVIGL
ncbi:hypothetical protein C7N43_24095 [Sphingobacteriales bacterium UPWRP_1]|nr:hypothetical protein BVG80_12860 [Sphingobacteriales bacterium TSM_CSM]PSJ74436.1 hypothetical protein C7N43_24095 [Sphingobacteriales bacterium UPWRP_1]